MSNVSIEEELAFLRAAVDELSDMVARQDTEIATLTRRVEMLMRRAAEQEADGGGGVVLGDERPPHY
ncbi:SlyX family protein [Tropicimonas sp.]|uniref:SlyX family protein n=1 Tax=Tropicimonas sp. TaxID=2067044 RepID=UPI003A893C1C